MKFSPQSVSGSVSQWVSFVITLRQICMLLLHVDFCPKPTQKRIFSCNHILGIPYWLREPSFNAETETETGRLRHLLESIGCFWLPLWIFSPTASPPGRYDTCWEDSGLMGTLILTHLHIDTHVHIQFNVIDCKGNTGNKNKGCVCVWDLHLLHWPKKVFFNWIQLQLPPSPWGDQLWSIRRRNVHFSDSLNKWFSSLNPR